MDIHLNRGAAFADGDWNIIVRTDPGLERLLVNRAGLANQDGFIELEVRSLWPEQGLDLAGEFPPGTRIHAVGWWVEDSGHRNKTELHPLIAMSRGEPGSSVFIGQDLTGRFAVARTPLDHTFVLPLEPLPVLHDLSKGQTTPGTPLALREEALGSFDSSASQTAGGMALTVHLAAAAGPNMPRDQVPCYFARFTAAPAPILREHAEVTKESTGEGRFLQVALTAELDPAPGSAPFSSAGWEVDGMAIQGNRISVRFRYAPGSGLSGHQWTATGYGVTSYGQGTAGRRDRILARGSVRCLLEPSSVTLSAQPTPDGYLLRADLTKAHPLLETSLWWLAGVGEGTAPLPPGGSLGFEGLSVRDAGNGRIEVRYSSTERQRIQITARLETDIGESATASLELPPVP
jgi:hypothetical protein